MAPKPMATSLGELGSTPTFFSAALIITSPTPFSAFTAIVFPARSLGVRIELLFLTMMFCQLSSGLVPSTSLAEIIWNLMPCVRPIIAGTYPR